MSESNQTLLRSIVHLWVSIWMTQCDSLLSFIQRWTRVAIDGLKVLFFASVAQGLCNELWSVVHTQKPWRPTQFAYLIKESHRACCCYSACCVGGQRFTGIFASHIQDFEWSAVNCFIKLKISHPHPIRICAPNNNWRTNNVGFATSGHSNRWRFTANPWWISITWTHW